MRKTLFLILFLFSISLIHAQEKLSKEEKERREKNVQAGNPFTKFGSKAPVATLSKGKYLEVHDLDSIVTIGTIRWHVENQQIVGRLIRDMNDPDAQPIGDATGRWMSPDPLSEEFPSYSPYNFVMNNPLRLVDPDGRAPLDHWQLNNQGNLELAKKTNDNFNVFFDEKGKKIFQTNEQSTEMAKKDWAGKGDEYINKLKTTFINIAEQPEVYNTMVERAKETGFDNKLVNLPGMKEIGETYKKNGAAIGALEMLREMPKFASGNIFAGSGPNGFLTQLGKTIYTGVTGTDVTKDAKAFFHQALENSKQFIKNIEVGYNHGINQLTNGN
ncbi:RHS repeat domain-containing protein [[Flexibacter] sp. ATCC 35103]|uniref:RHS repeat domain-containing protein n=1 Tax=[Flexibacter] sp. ATCC 35103 TaxID=1937528 RepID=UPI0009CEC716|nr:hypothetical protein [[Flexibacter] sp. ATCC 35103]OMQ12262.1 hypothetical protein BXU01_05145 [[Flexibacter] sp. ATCC 35103]